MGKRTPTSEDDVVRLSAGALTALNAATPWALFSGSFNLHITGTFVGTVVVERSFDGGTSSAVLTSLGSPVAFTGPASEVLKAPEEGVNYRLRCSAFTSGTIQARLSQ